MTKDTSHGGRGPKTSCPPTASLTTSFPLYEHLLPLHSAGYTFTWLHTLPLATAGLRMVASTKDRLTVSFLTMKSSGRMDYRHWRTH